MKTKDKIIRIALISLFTGLLVAVFILGTDKYRKMNENNNKAVSAYDFLQRYTIQYLENAEAYILMYPLEGGESELQTQRAAHAKVLESKIDGSANLLGALTNQASSYVETKAIKRIAEEMNIYMNRFGTERYPVNETNLAYMENLFVLMGKYRNALEEEMDAYRGEDEKDFFNSETYLYYKAIKEGIDAENTWVLSAVTPGNEDDPQLGPKLGGIDEIPTVIHSEDQGLEYARAYFEAAYGDITMEDIEISGGGGSNIHGRMFTTYEYRYGIVEVEFYETGDIESVRFDYADEEGADESNWSQVTDENIAEAEAIAKDYFEKHGMDDYTLGSYYLGYRSGTGGYMNLLYSFSTYEDYYDDLNVIKFTFINGEEVLLETVWYPRRLESLVVDRSGFQDGYEKKDRLLKIIEPKYSVIKAFYQNDELEGNVQTYEWRFLVEKSGEQYFIIIDAESEEISGAYPVPEGWVMNGGD